MTNAERGLVVAVLGLFFARGAGAEPTSAGALCWRSLERPADAQHADAGEAGMATALASAGPDEVWLGHDGIDASLHRWKKGTWSSPPLPRGSMRRPLLVASPTGEVMLAAIVGGDSSIGALQVFRRRGDAWEELGPPLISSREPYTQVAEASIAFRAGGRPIVAWSEERHAWSTGFFVAEWNGHSWEWLGAPVRDGARYRISVDLLVDDRDELWLIWQEGKAPGNRGDIRVAHRSGASWQQRGRASLAKLLAGTSRVAHPSLVNGAEGEVWALWVAANSRGETMLSMARWSGKEWKRLAVPPAPGATGKTVRSAAAMSWRDAGPVVAWTEADQTENQRLFLAEGTPGGGWTMRLSGLHLVEGVSDVRNVRLAPGDGQSFFISWQEEGGDGREARLVRAHVCASDEVPAVPPKSIAARDTWPTTVEEAVKQIVEGMADEPKQQVRSTAKDELIRYHHGWGTGIRNAFGLWRGNHRLLKSCGRGKVVHPDDCSMTIIEAVWAFLQIPDGGAPIIRAR